MGAFLELCYGIMARFFGVMVEGKIEFLEISFNILFNIFNISINIFNNIG